MIDLIPTPYKIAALAVALVIAYFTGRSHGLERYYDFKASVEQAQEQVRIENERKLKEANDAVEAVSKSWAAALDHARRNPVVRVRNNCDTGTGTQSTGTGLKPNATTGLGFPSSTVDAAQCEELINLGIRDASQVLHLQSYISSICKTYGCE